MTDTKHTDSRYLICEKCHKRQYERGQTYTPGNNCECFGFKPKHTDSVEAVGSLLYEVKHQIEWDYSYYVSREKSTDGYWKRVSSIEDIPTHAVSTHRTHPVHEPDNLFLFKIYQYLLNHQQQVEEAVRKRNGVIKEYKDEGVMFVLKVEDGKTYEASMPIPKWAEVGKITMRTPNHQD